ncbi:hypothetical protein [Acidipropionibacterium timonense]|uniref:hypothetical protein n=1 Tax=Acidipropionibacterium timonense TaxID=2161818 RepID=UPI0010312C9C|nr:hypothetical protein [Acidipropionibacterium timonense]
MTDKLDLDALPEWTVIRVNDTLNAIRLLKVDGRWYPVAADREDVDVWPTVTVEHGPMTCAEHLIAAWDAATVPEDGKIRSGERFISLTWDAEVTVRTAEHDFAATAQYRLMTQRPRPAWMDAEWVWADTERDERVLWHHQYDGWQSLQTTDCIPMHIMETRSPFIATVSPDKQDQQ